MLTSSDVSTPEFHDSTRAHKFKWPGNQPRTDMWPRGASRTGSARAGARRAASQPLAGGPRWQARAQEAWARRARPFGRSQGHVSAREWSRGRRFPVHAWEARSAGGFGRFWRLEAWFSFQKSTTAHVSPVLLWFTAFQAGFAPVFSAARKETRIPMPGGRLHASMTVEECFHL